MTAQENIILAEPSHEIELAQSDLKKNPAIVYLAGLQSKRSRRVQADALNVIADILAPGATYLDLPWHEVEYIHAQAVRAALIERYSAASANRMLSALRMTMSEAYNLGLISSDTDRRISKLKTVKGSSLPSGRQVTTGEIKALLDVCINDQGPAGYRDAAIIAWMVCNGPRRSEIAAANLSDFDPETGLLKIIGGKGNKDRTNYIENGAAEAMADWLQVRGTEPGPLFIPIDRHDNMELRRMSAQAIYSMINRRIEQAGIKDFSPHDLRRTFISNMLDAGADIATVSKIVGHSSIKTTARYDRRPEQAKKKATQLLSVPYRRRLAWAS